MFYVSNISLVEGDVIPNPTKPVCDTGQEKK